MPIKIPDELPATATLEAEGVVVMRGVCPPGWCSSVRAVGFGAGSVATGAEAHRAVEVAG
jgi:hypothetical protein